MEHIYNIAKFAHVLGFAFMSIPLFNLIVVNERALMGPSFNYETDRYFENIIKRGAIRCYVFQFTVFVSGPGAPKNQKVRTNRKQSIIQTDRIQREC